MARIRTIKPEFWTSDQVMECSPIARLLFIGLWNFCDDKGRHPASPKQIKALVFPSDDIPVADIRNMIDELSANGLVRLYTVDGKEYLSVTGWHHQKIDRPQPAKYPAPVDDHSTNGLDGKEGRGEERKGEDPSLRSGGRARASAIDPEWKPDEATTADLAGLGLSAAEIEREARKFRAHYRANGERRADWQAAFAKWCERPIAEKPAPSKGSGVVALTADMPSWEPWRAYYRDRGQTGRVSLMDAAREQRKPFSVPSEWPPGAERAA